MYSTANKDKDPPEKHFSFKNELSVGQCKTEICEAFDITGDDINNHTLFRLDGFGDPAFAVKKEKAGFAKNNISSGDTLALKNNNDLTPEE